LEIQDRRHHLLFQQRSKRLDVFFPDPARYGHHHEILVSQDPINFAAHCDDVFRSVLGEHGRILLGAAFEPPEKMAVDAATRKLQKRHGLWSS
jgi:hypothetical protein